MREYRLLLNDSMWAGGLPGLSCRHEIDACGHEDLYMHVDTLQLISFYKTFGFVPLPEDQLPKDDKGVVPLAASARWRGVMSARCGGGPVGEPGVTSPIID